MGKITNLVIYTNKISSNMKLLILSDLHLTKLKKSDNLDFIKKNIDMKEISFVLMPGDIVNDVNELYDSEFKERVQEQLMSITLDKNVFVSKGNHDQMTRNVDGNWSLGDVSLFEDMIKSLDNYHYVNNSDKYQYNEIFISGLSLGFDYYETSYRKRRDRENINDYLKAFKARYNENLFSGENFNIFLTHEPHSIINLSNIQGQCIQPNTDLVVSGHMHNGLLPNFLQPLVNNRGLVSPQMNFFPKYACGVYRLSNTNFVINGPVNTYIEMPMINKLYGANATVLTLKKSK